jgi:hypothetical protein
MPNDKTNDDTIQRFNGSRLVVIDTRRDHHFRNSWRPTAQPKFSARYSALSSQVCTNAQCLNCHMLDRSLALRKHNSTPPEFAHASHLDVSLYLELADAIEPTV